MLFSPLGLLAAASGLLSLTSAHNIQMKAHQRECFHEQLHKDDKMTVTFQVGDREFGGSGNLDIDFWIETPSRSYQIHERGVSSGDHSFDAKEDGKYTYCFNNEHWGANTKEVSFNVHGIVYVPEHEAPQDPLERARFTGEGRAELHCCPREDPQEHCREHQCPRQVVEHLSNSRPRRERRVPSVVAEEVLRSQTRSLRLL